VTLSTLVLFCCPALPSRWAAPQPGRIRLTVTLNTVEDSNAMTLHLVTVGGKGEHRTNQCPDILCHAGDRMKQSLLDPLVFERS
jgi:hypothetical protein